MKRITGLALALVLVLSSTVHAQEGTFHSTLNLMLPEMQRVSDAFSGGSDIFDPDVLATLDEASDSLITILEANPPEACWAEYWGDMRAVAMLEGQIPEAMDAMDTQQITAFLISATFMLEHAQTVMPGTECP